MLKLTTDKHEASRGLSATAEILVWGSYHVFRPTFFEFFIYFFNVFIIKNVSKKSMRNHFE